MTLDEEDDLIFTPQAIALRSLSGGLLVSSLALLFTGPMSVSLGVLGSCVGLAGTLAANSLPRRSCEAEIVIDEEDELLEAPDSEPSAEVPQETQPRPLTEEGKRWTGYAQLAVLETAGRGR